MKRSRFFSILLIITLLVTAMPASHAQANGCLPALAGTEAELAAAINCYNSEIDSLTYTITLTANINLTASTPTIDNTTSGVDLLIKGEGYIIDGQLINGVKPLTIATGTTVTLLDITIKGGVAQDVNAPGGGINNAGTLTINNSIITGNKTDDNDGAGIYSTGTLTVKDSTLSENKATNGGHGGGIYSKGTLSITSSILSGNTTDDIGGGIYINSGTSTITNSTFSQNEGKWGGGIHNNSAVIISNTTFVQNTATWGGGIFNMIESAATITNSSFYKNSVGSGWGGGILNGIDATMTLTNSTLSSNISTFIGGGLNNDGTLNISNTIIANSTGADCINSTGTIATNVNNLIEDGSCGAALSGDPALGALADNGGPTETMALAWNSPALDAGDASSCPTTDQRGVTRIASTCDIGAYERDVSGPEVVSTSLQATYANSGPSTFAVTFNKNVSNLGNGSNANDAENPNNYILLEEGSPTGFQMTYCSSPDFVQDTRITINNVSYNDSAYTSTVSINNGTPLPEGSYKLLVCGTTSIMDAANNRLNGGDEDHTVAFTVTAAATALPATGFRHGQVTQLAKQPTAKAYTDTAMTLEIPKLGVSMPIVGVAQTGSEWDVSWLGNSAGYLYGSAFPTWAGNTVITGHVWDAYNRPGAFAELKSLKYGDQVQIQAWGETYTYEVRESKLVTQKNTNIVFQSEQYDWVTLVTCEFYNPFNGEYLFRRVVRAVLVSVK